MAKCLVKSLGGADTETTGMEAGMEESKLVRHYPFSKHSSPEMICRNTMSGYSKTTGCVTDKEEEVSRENLSLEPWRQKLEEIK